VTAGNPKNGLEAVLIDRDAAARRNIQNYLNAQGNPRRWRSRESRPRDCIWFAVSGKASSFSSSPANPTEALEAVRRLRADMPQLGIVVSAREVSPELILRSMPCGRSRIPGASSRHPRAGRGHGAPGECRGPWANANSANGKIITLFSAKGGTGVTSVAVNLAVALAKRDAKTVLVDLDLQLGDAALMHDLQPRTPDRSLAWPAPWITAKLRTMLTSHDSGLSILASPAHLDLGDKLTAVQVGEVLSLLQNMFEYVIIDAGRTFDPRPLEALKPGRCRAARRPADGAGGAQFAPRCRDALGAGIAVETFAFRSEPPSEARRCQRTRFFQGHGRIAHELADSGR
jgi:Mrp family chromosome partitioning ATPase